MLASSSRASRSSTKVLDSTIEQVADENSIRELEHALSSQRNDVVLAAIIDPSSPKDSPNYPNDDHEKLNEPHLSLSSGDVEFEPQFSSSAVEEVSALVWRMNIGAVGEPTFTGPSGNFCFPTSPAASSMGPNSKPTEINTMSVLPDTTLYSQDSEMKQRLVDLFMEHINPFQQFVQSSTLFLVEFYPLEDQNLNLLYSAIFAAGACYAQGADAKQAGDVFAAHAESIALKSCRSSPSIIGVQALSILAWRELSQEHNNIAWIYNSMAGSLATALGLHAIGLQDLSNPTYRLELQNRESRIRTFWAFFLMDRSVPFRAIFSIATSILGRNCSVPWRCVEVPDMDSVLGAGASINDIAFSHQCKLWYLHDKFMDQIYAFEFNTMDSIQRNRLLVSAHNAMLNYKKTLPESLKNPPCHRITSAILIPSVLFLRMSYDMSLMLIYRPFLREPPTTNSFRLAVATMTLAAANMTRHIQIFQKSYAPDRSTQNQTLIPPHFIVHHILTASIMHLLSGTSQKTKFKTHVKRKLQICMDFLATLQTTWVSATKAIAQIQELARRWKVISMLPTRFKNEATAVESHDSSTFMVGIAERDMDSTLEAFFNVEDYFFDQTAGFLDQDFETGFIRHENPGINSALFNTSDDLRFGSHSQTSGGIQQDSWPISFDVDQNAVYDMHGFSGFDV
ncbi:hypothetical protein G7Y89_g3285 [Cudoniella acicularis]|uniref:Xylanolytic transcriptional activator regulatory domain-containing protein n=1 Tax=Cudoniella acicularis TaxID=354080 RepID=A0A8H4RSV9_9HELO|nr:hypothetical protein G7Y89_g3285 [Cudoniella acicularis]